MTVVASGGELVNIARPAVLPATQLRLSDNRVQDYATLVTTQPQVRTVIQFLARNIAQLGLPVYRRKSDVDRERLSDHPLAQLIARPNSFTTRYRLFDSLVWDLAGFGNAFWLKTYAQGRHGVLRLPPQMVTPTPPGASWMTVDSYRVRGNRGYRDFPAEEIVHFRGHNPTDPRWGSSPIESLRRTLAEESAAGIYREQLWRNGARISGYLRRPAVGNQPGNAPHWSPEARARFKAEWQAQYAGDGPQAGGTPILEDGMEFEKASVTPEQAQYIEARKLTREEVAAAYFIPPPMIGILDHATFSNITEQHKMLYQDCLGPWLEMIQEDIELQLLGDFPNSADVYVEFNMAEKLKGSFEDQARSLQSAVGGPWMTRNEARGRMNLPQLEDPAADELVTPMNVTAGGLASPNDTAPKSGAPDTHDRDAESLALEAS